MSGALLGIPGIWAGRESLDPAKDKSSPSLSSPLLPALPVGLRASCSSGWEFCRNCDFFLLENLGEAAAKWLLSGGQPQHSSWLFTFSPSAAGEGGKGKKFFPFGLQIHLEKAKGVVTARQSLKDEGDNDVWVFGFYSLRKKKNWKY